MNFVNGPSDLYVECAFRQGSGHRLLARQGCMRVDMGVRVEGSTHIYKLHCTTDSCDNVMQIILLEFCRSISDRAS